MMLQLNPTIPLDTPKGPALAHVLIDNGDEHHLIWVCIQSDTGEIWAWPNTQVRGKDNPTMGRNLKKLR
jgi:L-arabinose isomerase